MSKKIRVGWFSFTCCEGCAVTFIELLNNLRHEWFKKIEFVQTRLLRKDNGTEIKDMDIAFIEGVISSDKQEEKLKTIRQKARILIAAGSCAVSGPPSNQRNSFNEDQLGEIQTILEKFRYKSKVVKPSDIVKIDETVSGCPINEEVFLQTVNRYLNSTPLSAYHKIDNL